MREASLDSGVIGTYGRMAWFSVAEREAAPLSVSSSWRAGDIGQLQRMILNSGIIPVELDRKPASSSTGLSAYSERESDFYSASMIECELSLVSETERLGLQITIQSKPRT